MEPARSRRRAPWLVAAVALLWMLVVAVVYFAPAARAGLEELLHSSAPGSAISVRALARGAVRLAGATAVLLAAWGLGAGALRCVPARHRAAWGATPLERYLTATGLGIGVLYGLALALSALGLLRPAALAAVIVLGVVVAAPQLPRRHPRRPSVPADTLQRASLALIGAAAVFALVGALAPEVEYDALWYHLTLPERALATGSLVDEPCQYVAQYPQLTELLFGYGLALDGAITAKLVHLGFGALAALATYAIGARVVSRRTGLVAAAILVTTPTFLWEATTAYVDLATAFFVALALLWVLRFVERPGRAAVVLAGLCLGLALATKHLAAIAALPLVAIVLLAPRGLAGRDRLTAAGLFGGVALLAPLPFYVRAEILAGNPVFPSLYGLFGADPQRWDAASDAGLEAFFDRFGYGDGPLSIAGLPWTTTMHGAAFGGSIGVAYLMLAPLALRRRMPRGLLLTALFCLGYLLLWASPVSSLQMRFVVPVLGPLAIVAAAGLERVLTIAPRRVAGAAAVVALAVLALSLPPFVRLHERERDDDTGEGYLTHVLRGAPADVVLGAEPERAYLARKVPAYEAVRRLNELSGPEDRVVVTTDPYPDFYAQAQAVPDYALCLRLAGLGGGGPEDHRALRRRGVDYLVVEDRLADSSALPWADPAFARRYLDLAYADGRARLYRVRERPAG